MTARPPDLLVDPALRMAAVRGAGGEVTLVEWRRDRLVRDAWLRHLGVAAAAPGPRPWSGPARGVGCDEAGCVVELDGLKVSLARGVEAAVEDCGLVELVIARVGPEACRGGGGGALVEPRALRASGGLAITHGGDRLTVETVAARRGDWPWTRCLTYQLN